MREPTASIGISAKPVTKICRRWNAVADAGAKALAKAATAACVTKGAYWGGEVGGSVGCPSFGRSVLGCIEADFCN